MIDDWICRRSNALSLVRDRVGNRSASTRTLRRALRNVFDETRRVWSSPRPCPDLLLDLVHELRPHAAVWVRLEPRAAAEIDTLATWAVLWWRRRERARLGD